MSALPVDLVLDELNLALEEHGAAVLVAPPGSGKTTRVPPALLAAGAAGDRSIVMLEPRRVAARAAARFLARARGERVGETVGHHVRFDRVAGPDTRILVVTEGLLTRRLLGDPFLEDVGVVVLDEFHERSRHADLALALLAEVRREVRPDLKVVVMSATIDPGPIAHYLGDVPIVRSDGRAHAVEIVHEGSFNAGDLEVRVRDAVIEGWERHDGSTLVFLPGKGEIRRAESALAGWAQQQRISVLPLHGELKAEQQDEALRGGQRRVVLATNVAETSVTVEGVCAVVDTGLARRVRHDAVRGVDHLELGRISRASADQRAGRAGRQGPGLAWRLWSAGEHAALEAFDAPELQRCDLAEVVLDLAAWGVPEAEAFPWFEAPSSEGLVAARERAVALGLLPDEPGPPTALGRRVAELGVGLREGRLLLEAARLGQPRLGALAVALLGEREVGSGEARTRGAARSDLMLAVEALDGQGGPWADGHRRRLKQTAKSIERRLGRGAKATEDCDPEEALGRAVFVAFADRLARRRSPGSPEGVLRGGRGVRLADSSAVREGEFFVALDIAEGLRAEHALVRRASFVDPDWFADAGLRIERDLEVVHDVERDRVVGHWVLHVGDLVLERRPESRPDPARVEEALAAAILAPGTRVTERLPDGFAKLLARLRFLVRWRAELAWPDLDDDAIRQFLAECTPGQKRIGDVLSLPLQSWLEARLDTNQRRALAEEAPESWSLPNGRRLRIRYEDSGEAVVSGRVQELFGQWETPRLAGGRVTCLVELLAPNRRPVQRTRDLPSFWTNTYQQVRKDLRGRYPKHDWPEEPPGG